VTVIRIPTAEDFKATADRLALRVAELVRERDIANGEAQDAIGTGLRLKAERDTARGEAKVLTHVNAALKLDLARSDRDNRRLTEQVVELTAERDLAVKAAEDVTRALCDAERELHERGTRRWRRRKRKH
jgi:hypothetical protein